MDKDNHSKQSKSSRASKKSKKDKAVNDIGFEGLSEIGYQKDSKHDGVSSFDMNQMVAVRPKNDEVRSVYASETGRTDKSLHSK